MSGCGVSGRGDSEVLQGVFRHALTRGWLDAAQIGSALHSGRTPRELLGLLAARLDPGGRRELFAVHAALRAAPAPFAEHAGEAPGPPSPGSPAPSSPPRLPRPPEPEETPGRGLRRVGAYRLLRVLGRGAMGEVYLAERPGLGRPCALKLLPRETATERACERLRREAQALARVQHPGVVGVLDADADPQAGFFIAMELVHPEGRTLADRLREARGPLDPREAAGLVREVGAALAAIHAAGLVHRDVKPSNVLLSPQGEAVLGDLGLARGDGETLTRTGQLNGTPAYLAPELVSGTPADPRSDLFSLGVLFFELLAGERPFLPPRLGRAIRLRDPGSPSRRRARCAPAGELPPIDPELEVLCALCLAKDPRERPADAAALAADLERYLAGRPIRARAIPWSRRLRGRVRREPQMLIPLLAAGCLLLGGLPFALSRLGAITDELEAVEASAEQTQARADGLRAVEAETRRVALAAAREALESARQGNLREPHARERTAARIAQRAFPELEALLHERLEAVRAALEASSDALYREVATVGPRDAPSPRPDLGDLQRAVQRFREGVPLEELALAERLALTQAHRRLGLREGVRDTLRLFAARQEEDLSPALLDEAPFVCTALGEFARGDGARRAAAVALLGRYLSVEADPVRASAAGIALCRLGGPEALRWVQRARCEVFGLSGSFSERVKSALKGLAVELVRREGESEGHFLERRSELRDAIGDPEGAVVDATRGIELEPERVALWGNRAVSLCKLGCLQEALADLHQAINLEPRLELLHNRALLYLQLGDCEAALRDVERALAAAPGEPLLLLVRADARMMQGQALRAIEDCDQVVRRDPGNEDALVTRGYSHLSLGNTSRARADAELAVEIASHSARAWTLRAQVRALHGEPAEGLEDAEQALALARNDLELVNPALFARGVARLRLGLAERALDDFRTVCARDPDVEHRVWLAVALLETRRTAAAIDEATAVLAASPNHAEALSCRGTAYQQQGRLDAALADFQRLRHHHQDLAEAHFRLGGALLLRGEARQAAEALEKAGDLDAACAPAWANLALARLSLGEYSLAIEAARRALVIDGTLTAARVALARALQLQGQAQEARAELDGVVEDDKLSVPALLARARVRFASDPAGALADCRKAIRDDPTSVDAWLTSSECKGHLRDWAGAVEDATQATRIAPQNPKPWAHRALLQLTRGWVDLALADARRAIELEDATPLAWWVLGLAHRTVGEWEAARSAFAGFLERFPGDQHAPEARRLLQELPSEAAPTR